MAAAIVLRTTRRYLKIGRLILLAVLAIALFNVYTTFSKFSRGNEHLTKKSDFVHSLGSFSGILSTERLQRSTGNQRGKVPNVLRFN